VGVLDGADYTEPDKGTIQGSGLSPLLGNIYLHYVLDLWFEREVKLPDVNYIHPVTSITSPHCCRG
jgi:retron-type reverse transcriptase